MKYSNSFFTIFILSLLCIVSLNNCSLKNPQEKTIDEEKFIKIYCDVVIHSDLVNSRYRTAFIDSVFQSYNITKKDFQSTIDVYSEDKIKWEEIFKKILFELEQRDKEFDIKKDSLNVKKNKINLK